MDHKPYNYYYTHIIGFIILYFFVILLIPYYLLDKSYFSLFLTYFANVDIIANILAINFPTFFKYIYNIQPTNLFQNISYNVISLVALTGIFIHGISQKNKGSNDFNILSTMIIMSIITWTLPTQLIPYFTNKIKKRLHIKNIELDVLISTIISISFIIIEFILIHLYIKNINRLKIHKYLSKYKFKL